MYAALTEFILASMKHSMCYGNLQLKPKNMLIVLQNNMHFSIDIVDEDLTNEATFCHLHLKRLDTLKQ